MIENGKLTYANIEELCKMAQKYECDIAVIIRKDEAEINITKAYVTEIESNTKTTQKPPINPVVVTAKSDDEFRKLQEDLRKEGWGI